MPAKSLASYLETNIERIVSLWIIRIRQEVSATRKEEKAVLRDEIPAFLNFLAQSLDGITPDSVIDDLRIKIGSKQIAIEHGKQRAATGSYTLNDAIFEYHILRLVLFQVLEEYRPIDLIEREVIVSAIEYAVKNMASQFAKAELDAHDLFVLTLVHDLRGPLNNASMAAQMLKRNSNPERIESTLDILEQNLRRLDKMATTLLDLRKLASGEHLPLKFEDVDLVTILYALTEGMNLGSRIQTVTPKSLTGYWSPDGIQRVLENLVSNALKYGDSESSVTITIKDLESSALISVHNMGKPIPEEDQSAIFRPHFQSPSQPANGWGIGLALVKRIIDAHRGTVFLSSSEEAGTTFKIELPKDLAIKH